MDVRPGDRLIARGLRNRLGGPFDLTLDAGECVAVSGPSGCGKTMLLRMIADLDPSEGEVLLDGRERSRFTGPQWRRRVVYNAAEPGWWSENVEAHFPQTEQKAQARKLAACLGLEASVLTGPVNRLSTGERQRLALIRALLLDPPVLLLDEPTAALDPAATTSAEAMLRERQAAGTAILLVTHGAEQAARIASRHLRIAAGQFVAP
jgi:ABC-type iron transport system FetAB ATPase subunit